MKNNLIATTVLVLVLFFLHKPDQINADYQISCGGRTVTCPCDQCPSASGYTCPGGASDQCLRIGCTCDASDPSNPICRWSGGRWSSCNGGGGPPPPPPPGGSCSGDCFPSAANCGVYGRPGPGSGSCPSGQMCCAGFSGGGGGPTPTPGPTLPPQWDTCNAFLPSPANNTMNVGETRSISIRLKQGSFSRLAIGLTSGANTISNLIPRNFGGSSLVLDNRYEYRSTTLTALSPGTNRWTVYLYDTFAGYEILRCSKSVNVTVNAPVATPTPLAPTVDLTANGSQGPISVVSGSSVNLSWSVTGATSCSASGSWSGNKNPSSGTETSNNINSSRNFTLVCTGPGGTTSDSVVVNLQGSPASPVVQISASPNTLPSGGGSTVLTWSSTDSVGCVASGGWTGARGVSGSQTVGGITVDTVFNLTCTGPGGSGSASASVSVAGVGQCSPAAPRDPATPICAPNPPTQNGAITWTWPVVPLATEYSFQVVDANTGNLIAGTQTGWQNGQTFFNCRPNTVDICSIETDLPPGQYRSQIQARNLGPGGCNVSAVATYPNPPAPGIEVDVCTATSWWQVRGSDVISQGNIQSRIPVSCVGPTCIARLIASSSTGSNGGVLLRGSVLDTGAGTVSDNNWDAQISLLGRQPRYADFVTLIPSSVTVSDPGANPSSSAITSPPGSSLSGGYYWLRRSGDIRISQPLVVPSATRVILFVDGVANIDEDISFANIDNSFFMIVARNGIRVGTNPDTIQGIFYTEGGFDSGTGSNPLAVTGSTTALGGVTLGRDLGVGNRTAPAEVFTLSPELLLNYPQTLTFKRPLWQEVAP